MNRIVRRLLAAVLAGMSLFAIAAFGLIATGRAGFVVTHGVSMNPVYYQGDLVVIAKAPSYTIGEIVAYHRAGHSDVVLHRIVGGGPAGYVFKGDNNQSIDPTRPTEEQLAGRAVYHLSSGGLWLHRLTSPTALGLLAFTLLAGGGTAARTRPRGRRARLSKHASTSSKPLSLSALPPALRACAAAAGAVGALGLAVGALGWGGPLDTESTVSTHSANRMTFAYTASVGRTPAYDGTTASSPDPVFRKLANDVDVHFSYTGAPGSISVNASVSTANGWHTTFPLAKTVRFVGKQYEGTVRLNLQALDARARAAAAVTGLPTTQATVIVTPRVQSGGAAVFEPRLGLSMSPLQLTLLGDTNALTVNDTAVSKHQVRVPRTVGVRGVRITANTARTASAISVAAAVLAAGALALLARRLSPAGEGAEIRRRYAPSLVRVHPMTAPAGRAVIDVTEFATLLKVAERYGLLILHWSRSEVDTFLVQDEGGTYRYRTGTGSPAVITDKTTAQLAEGA